MQSSCLKTRRTCAFLWFHALGSVLYSLGQQVSTLWPWALVCLLATPLFGCLSSLAGLGCWGSPQCTPSAPSKKPRGWKAAGLSPSRGDRGVPMPSWPSSVSPFCPSGSPAAPRCSMARACVSPQAQRSAAAGSCLEKGFITKKQWFSRIRCPCWQD